MNLNVEPYIQQQVLWPTSGRHILAQYDDDSIVVYQAYKPAIGHFAARNGYFGGQFLYTRMSWCKPNFLWMMYRSGWGTKEGQEVTLAIRLKRAFFDHILEQAVSSSYVPELYPDRESWQEAVTHSEVRVQWDPDHDPSGAPQERRAIQLGLRGKVLEEYGREAILEVEDISAFVQEQRPNATVLENYARLLTPSERVYIPFDTAIVSHLHLSSTHES